MRMISRWVVGVALLFGVLLFMLPKRDETSLARIASASMLMCTTDFRDQVARQVIGREAVSAKFRNPCPDLIAALDVSERGDMVMTNKKYRLKMTLNPVVEAGKVRWSCRGEPAAAVAKLCRP